MTKLIVFDKDGTLTEPASGAKFPQHPHDQQLRPGVAAKLAELRDEGWAMAIASNQGGCDRFDCEVKDLRPGMLISIYERDEMRVEFVRDTTSDPVSPVFWIGFEGRSPEKAMAAYPGSKFKVRYKTIDAAIAEMRYAMELTGIDEGYFCPDMAGNWLVSCGFYSGDFWFKERDIETIQGRFPIRVDGFRKPQSGMLDYAKMMDHAKMLLDPTQCFMVGDRPEDEAAAKAAGFDFAWADDFFGGTIDA